MAVSWINGENFNILIQICFLSMEGNENLNLKLKLYKNFTFSIKF